MYLASAASFCTGSDSVQVKKGLLGCNHGVQGQLLVQELKFTPAPQPRNY